MILEANGSQKKVDIATSISAKKGNQTHSTRHYVVVKRTLQEGDRIAIHIYAAKIYAPKYINTLLMYLKGEL